MTIPNPAKIYQFEELADCTAADLAATECDGWTYIVRRNFGGYVVSVHNEAGEFVAFWS